MNGLLKYSASQIKDFLEVKVFFLFSVLFCFNFILISQFIKWTKTEVYPVHSSKYLFSAFDYEFLFALKPIFYSLLKVFFVFSELLPIEPMNLSRFVFALNGLSLLYFLYLYLEKKTNRYNAVLALLILTSSYIFLNRGFRVRSDMLASSFSLFILWVNLNGKNNKKQAFLLFLFLSLLFITPKAIYWLLLNLLLLEKHTRQTLLKKPSLKTLLILSCFSIGTSFLLKDPFFIKSIYESGQFYLLSFKIFYLPILEKSFAEAWSYFLVRHFIDKNYILLFLIGLKFLSTVYQCINSKSITRQNLYFLVLFSITSLHPDPKLVFFSALSPFFIIAFFTDSVWLKIVNKSYSETFKTLLLGCFFLYTFSYIGFFSYTKITKINNLTQKKIIKQLNYFYKNTPSKWNILDPSCLIYSRKTTCKYLLFQVNFNQMEYIKENSFDIILSSKALSISNLLIDQESNIQYVSVKNHILYKAFVIDTKWNKNLKQDNKTQINQIIQSKQDTHLDRNKKRNQNAVTNQKSKESKQLFFLNGNKVFNELVKTIGRDSLEGTYFYTYIDSWNRSIIEKSTPEKSASKKSEPEKTALLPFKIYSEKEWRESFIPVKDQRIAVFYLSFPLDLNEKESLRFLLKYDVWR